MRNRISRRQITEDYYADIVIFNPETIIDMSTFDNPHQYPEEVEYVVVNGEVVVQQGEHTGLLPRKILRKS